MTQASRTSMAVRVVSGPRRTPLGRLCPELRAPGNHREREIMMARHHSPGQSWSTRGPPRKAAEVHGAERILEIAGTTHLLLETPDESRTNIAASPIESALERLRERIDLIAIATLRKGHDLTTEFVKPACASW